MRPAVLIVIPNLANTVRTNMEVYGKPYGSTYVLEQALLKIGREGGYKFHLPKDIAVVPVTDRSDSDNKWLWLERRMNEPSQDLAYNPSYADLRSRKEGALEEFFSPDLSQMIREDWDRLVKDAPPVELCDWGDSKYGGFFE